MSNETKSSSVIDEEIEKTKKGDAEKDREPAGPRIRCPRCGWTPRKNDRWMCMCKHVWNTFDTGGVCPACLYQWMITMCLACHRWSAHSAWYTHEEK